MRILTAKATIAGIAAAFLGVPLSQSANAEYLYNMTWETLRTPTMYLETAPSVGIYFDQSSPVIIDRSAMNNTTIPTTFRSITQPVIVEERDRRLLHQKLF